jgi:hypothetical protein
VECQSLLQPRTHALAQLRRHGVDGNFTRQDRRVRPVAPRRSR